MKGFFAMKLSIRRYEDKDAQTIIDWLGDRITFYKWSAGKIGDYPISPDKLNSFYKQFPEKSFLPLTVYDESGAVGHVTMRYTDAERKTVKLGFIIVDGTKRGCGYAKIMLKEAMEYAYSNMGAELITVSVFENNLPAVGCYKSLRFSAEYGAGDEYINIDGEEWKYTELGRPKCVSL